MSRVDPPIQANLAVSKRWQSLLWIAAIALVYFAVARFSLSFLFEPEGIAAVWPPSGIFLSAVLLTRKEIRLYLVMVLFFTDLVAEMWAGTPWVVSLVYSAALTGDALFSAWLLERFSNGLLTFRSIKQVIRFLLLSLLLSNALLSIVAALAATTFLRVPFWSSWLWWWSSDGVGSLLVTPLIMSLVYAIRSRFTDFQKGQIIEGAILFLSMAILDDFAFSMLWDESWFLLLLNLFIFPFMIWAAFRFGVLGAATANAILAAIILQHTIAGSFLHFDVTSEMDAIILVQAYIAMACIPSIMLAALVTEHKQDEARLRERITYTDTILENAPIGFAVNTIDDGKGVFVSSKFDEIYGVPQGSMNTVDEYFENVYLDPVFRAKIRDRMLSDMASGDASRMRWENIPLTTLNGENKVVTAINIPLLDRNLMVSTVQDVTERNQAEEQVKAALVEKETLLRELYHRTRNNMSVIIAMLQLRAASLPPGPSQFVFRDMENRIKTMALVHQILYQSHDLSRINLKNYVDDLVQQLVHNYQISPERTQVNVDVQDIAVLIDIAIPCGMILNELISNAFQHAFPGDRPGKVDIRIYRAGPGELMLCVSDDGVGVPAGFDWRAGDSLGMKTIFGVAEHQLSGQVEFQAQNGVTCQVRFRDDLYSQRV